MHSYFIAHCTLILQVSAV